MTNPPAVATGPRTCPRCGGWVTHDMLHDEPACTSCGWAGPTKVGDKRLRSTSHEYKREVRPVDDTTPLLDGSLTSFELVVWWQEKTGNSWRVAPPSSSIRYATLTIKGTVNGRDRRLFRVELVTSDRPLLAAGLEDRMRRELRAHIYEAIKQQGYTPVRGLGKEMLLELGDEQ